VRRHASDFKSQLVVRGAKESVWHDCGAFLSLRNVGFAKKFCSTLAGCRFATTACPVFKKFRQEAAMGCGLPGVFESELPQHRLPAARLAPDAIVPVPLYRQRRRERGFNPVDLIGRPLAKRFRLPYQAVLLMRERERPEKHLPRSEER
jgi:hypothetical protein